MATQGVGTYKLNSFWESGRLIFYEKADGHTTTGNVFILGHDYVQVGDTGNDVNFVWDGLTTGTFTLDAEAHTLVLTGLATTTDGAVTITSTLAVSSTSTFSENVTIGTNKRLYFRDTGIYLNSSSDGEFTITADGTGPWTIGLQCGTGGGIELGGYAHFFQTDTDGSTKGQMWYDNSENKLKYFTTVVLTLVDTSTAQTFTNNLTMATNKAIYFRDSTISIASTSAGRLTITASEAGPFALSLQTPTGSGIELGGYALIYPTDTDGDYRGQMWYDISEAKIKYFTTVARTLVDTGTAQTFTANLTMGTNNGIFFRDSGIKISSTSDGRLTITADEDGPYAISLQTPGTGGGIEMGGYLFLYRTDTDGAVEGQLWWDDSENKLHFFNGTATECVISTTATDGSFTTAYPITMSSTTGQFTQTCTALAADTRGTRFVYTCATPAMSDGYGAFEIDLTISGTGTGGVTAANTWINLGGSAIIPSSMYLRNDGIYDGGGTLNAANIAMQKYQCHLASNPAWLSIWELNYSQTANNVIDSIFECNDAARALGYTTGTSAGNLIGAIPFMSVGGSGVKYVYIYDAPPS